MKKNCKRYLLCFLCAFLLLQCLTVGVYAETSYGDELEPDVDPYRDGDGNIIWSYNRENETIRGMGKEYTYYRPTQDLIFDGPTRYHFFRTLSIFDDDDSFLMGYSLNPEILEALYVDGFFVTEAGRVSLNALCAGNAANYRLRDSESVYGYSKRTEPLENGFVQSIMAGTDTVMIDVTTIEYSLVAYLYGYDGTDAYACQYGGLYEIDGMYFYIHYLTLGNQYFDAYGSFSYRSGTVEAVKLDETQASRLEALLPMMEMHLTENVWEGQEADEPLAYDSAVVGFVISVICLGFLLPLPLMIVSICMARSKKRGCPKYWYALTAVSAVWMAAALVLMIVLL